MFRSQVLAIRAFRDLWFGQSISIFGDAFYYVVNAFMVKQITGSSALVGVNGALETLPFLLVGPYAGVLADRLDRRRIMLLSDLLSFTTLMILGAVVFTTKTPPVEAILVNGFLLSCMRVFFTPAKNAAIPRLVPDRLLLKANALSASTQNVMPMISLALSAVVLGALYAISTVWFYLTAILCNAASFIGSAYFVRRLPPLAPERETIEAKHPYQDFRDGLSYILHRRVLKIALIQAFIVNLAISPFFVAYVSVNKEWFGGKPQTLSWFEFSFFLGMVLASALVGKLNVRKVGWGAIFGTALVGGTVMMMALTRRFDMWMFWNLVAGLGIPFSSIPMQSYIQLTVPDEFRGRVQSVSTMIAIGVQPIGLALGGMIVETAGLVLSLLMMGGGMVVAVFVGLADREFRECALPEMESFEGAPEPAIAG